MTPTERWITEGKQGENMFGKRIKDIQVNKLTVSHVEIIAFLGRPKSLQVFKCHEENGEFLTAFLEKLVTEDPKLYSLWKRAEPAQAASTEAYWRTRRFKWACKESDAAERVHDSRFLVYRRIQIEAQEHCGLKYYGFWLDVQELNTELVHLFLSLDKDPLRDPMAD